MGIATKVRLFSRTCISIFILYRTPNNTLGEVQIGTVKTENLASKQTSVNETDNNLGGNT